MEPWAIVKFGAGALGHPRVSLFLRGCGFGILLGVFDASRGGFWKHLGSIWRCQGWFLMDSDPNFDSTGIHYNNKSFSVVYIVIA